MDIYDKVGEEVAGAGYRVFIGKGKRAKEKGKREKKQGKAKGSFRLTFASSHLSVFTIHYSQSI